MTTSLAKALLADRQPGTQLLYGIATALNTVQVAGSTVAVELPALSPVIAGDYVAVLAAGADRLILGRVGPTAWAAVTFQNSWGNYGGTYQTMQYRRDGDMVQLRGVLNTAGASGSVAFTLPAGFRPPASLNIIASNSLGAQVALLDVSASTGDVTIYRVGTDSVGIATQFSVMP